MNGCTTQNKQEKADGCSVNGASPLDLTGRDLFIVRISQSSLIFHLFAFESLLCCYQ